MTGEKVSALDTLAVRPQWVCWRREGKRKAPYNPVTGRKASTTDPSTWGTYEEARAAENDYDGIGFVLSADDPFTFVDLDHCIEDGEVLPWTVEVVESLRSYTEVSPSDTGLHILVRGTKAGTYCRVGSIEIYDRNRFFTFTGKAFDGEKIEDRQEELDGLYRGLFGERERSESISTVVVDRTDEELLERARNASGKVRRLYDGDTSVCGGDRSRADNLLCWHLAFWFGKDAERIDRLFRGSNLMRPKWDERRGNSTYGEWTISHAIKTQPNTYDPKNYRVEVKDDIRQILEGCSQVAVAGDWSGRSGPTDRDVYRALISTVFEYGRKVDEGVEVCASERDIALKAGVGKKAAWYGLQRLANDRSLIRKVNSGGKRKSAKYILLTQTGVINNRVNNYDSLSSQTALIRNPGSTYGTIGKRNAQIIDYVHSVGRVVTDEELAEHFGMRKNNLKKRNIKLLLGLELLEEKDGGYVTPTNIRERLERELKDSGCEEAHQLQREQYERERRAWREMKNGKATTTVLIPRDDRDYLDPQYVCIHGSKETCYFHNPDHPYRLREKEMVA